MVVPHTTYDCNGFGRLFYHARTTPPARQGVMVANNHHRQTFIRDWRRHRKMSLDRLAAEARVDKSNISKIERGILQYNQDVLERIADALGTDAASLLARSPTDNPSLWSIMARASAVERQQIESVAAALISKH